MVRDGYLQLLRLLLIGAALVFMYSGVLWKLGYDWWTDDNYSHGLLVPFVIVYIVWQRFGRLRNASAGGGHWAGSGLIAVSAVLLLAGTLASVLFAQRISMLLMIAGVVVSLFGLNVLRQLGMPFLLLLLAIPIPQLLFNKIAFPLQIFASRVAGAVIRAFGIEASRKGNVIEIPFSGTGEIIGLEVVEACSGIRSLMTLITLALILGYFTRERRASYRSGIASFLSDPDVQRTALLMLSAVPVALITNATRVIVTGLIAHGYGHEGVEGLWHDISGSLVFIGALLLLVLLNVILKRLFDRRIGAAVVDPLPAYYVGPKEPLPAWRTALIFVAIVVCGAFVNWFHYRSEVQVGRRPLHEFPSRLGGWEQRNEDIRFDEESEKVLRASDYVMRDYYGPGKRLNLYVGYYASQRTGATYHSPLSCLPGTGWEMADPQLLEIRTNTGRRLTVNRYVINRGEHKEYLIYWYQGRGRAFANEYTDKFYTSLDSVTMRRSDGGMIRIMTPFGKDPERSLAAAIDLTGHVADNIQEFLPD